MFTLTNHTTNETIIGSSLKLEPYIFSAMREYDKTSTYDTLVICTMSFMLHAVDNGEYFNSTHNFTITYAADPKG